VIPLGFLLLLLGLRTECRDVCEVLEFDYVRSEPCSCICYDPVEKRELRTSDPGCQAGPVRPPPR